MKNSVLIALLVLTVNISLVGGFFWGVDSQQERVDYWRSEALDARIRSLNNPIVGLDFLISSMEQARDTHQNFVNNPEYCEVISKQGFQNTTVEDHKEWVVIYDWTIDILETLK